MSIYKLTAERDDVLSVGTLLVCLDSKHTVLAFVMVTDFYKTYLVEAYKLFWSRIPQLDEDTYVPKEMTWYSRSYVSSYLQMIDV